jgi:hypothetical protein
MANVFEQLTNVIAGLMINNIGTIETHNNTLALWTNTNAELTGNWTNGMPDPNSQMWQAYEALVSQENSSTNGAANPQMQNFIQTYMNVAGDNDDMYQFSQAFGVDLMNVLGTQGIYNSTNGPTQMTQINQFISLISSSAGQEEKIGQTESQTESSVTQNDANTQQGLADMGQMVNQAGGNPANILQQSF